MLRLDTDRACYSAQWGRGVLCVSSLDQESEVDIACSACFSCRDVVLLCLFLECNFKKKEEKKKDGGELGGPR